MGYDSTGHSWKFIVGNIKLFAGLLYYFPDGRVMNMADPGKQMMLHLKIQSSNKPGNNFIIRCKIGRCLHLKNGPFLLNPLVVIFCHVMKFRVLNHVCKLKNQRKS